MAPPYKLIDEATGLVVETDGNKWQGMDVPVGNPIEIFNTSGAWARISPGALIRPPDGPVTPPVDPPVNPPVVPPVDPPVDPPVVPPIDPTLPPVSGIPTMALPAPTTSAELQALANDAATKRYVVQLAPGTKITLDRTIIFKQAQHDGSVWGMDLNWAQLDWAGPAGGDMIRAEGVSGAANRGFVLTNGQFYGGGWWQDRGRANQAGACVRIRCELGDPMAYYKPTLQNLYTSYAVNGFVFEGAVFEFMHLNLHAENMTGDGMLAKSVNYTEGGQTKQAVMSNVFGVGPNMSRNGGSGITTGYSHNVIMGSFVQNSQYAINAPQGLRVGAFNNGENTGESLIKLGGDGYGSVIMANEMSSGWIGVNNENAPTTGPSKYVLDAAGAPVQPNNEASGKMGNHVATYGTADAHAGETRVRK